MNHATPNTTHAADVVVTTEFGTSVVWISDVIVAEVRNSALSLIIAGAAAMNRSVYDTESGRFLVGDVGQLDDADDA
jgi:hypothetical protein